ncbi:MAG: YjjG family noncanonical pyrimidine nucleotidase [Clostridia bacterium]|nr:YjjG family noncanonical pyrimidine nucleotidase [Clostridia bacterium]
MIKAVFFDIDNTLLDFNKCAFASMEKAFELRGMKSPARLQQVFVRINDCLWRRIEKGELTREGLQKIRFNLIFAELGIELDGIEFERDFQEALSISSEKVDGAEDILKYLSGKYRLFVTSNAQHSQQTNRLELAGLAKYFENIFTSGIIGHPKPSKEFFNGCMAFLPELSRQEIIIIGDSLTADIIGGAENGFKTCWFNYGKVVISEKLGLSKEPKPDYTVSSLGEIKNIL